MAKKIVRLGISGALPWAWTYSQVCRGLEEVWRGREVPGTPGATAADQFGATAHRVGPGVKAAAHVLHYGAGVPVRKLPRVLKELTGISLTQGAMTQDALRRGEAEVGTRYQQLCRGMREAPVVNTDDTGWRVGGRPAHLMVFVSAESTVYQIRGRHRNEEVREVIPGDYAGVMGTDRDKSYDAKEFDAVAQQKCLSHLQRNLTKVLETKKGRARQFGLGLKDMLGQSIELYHKRSDLEPADYQLQVQEIDDALTFHLRHRILKDDDNQRLLDGIGLHQDHGNLLRFLHVEGLEPTNNRAERALRPAVIARKVSHCSKEPTRRRSFRGFRQCDSDSHSGGRSIHHRLFAGSLLASGVAIRVILLRSQPNPLPKTQSPRQTEGGLNLVARLCLA